MPQVAIVLTERDRAAIASGYCESTMRNHRSRIMQFHSWVRESGLQLPVKLLVVQDYLDSLYRHEVISIAQHASSILRGGFEEEYITSSGYGYDEQRIIWLRYRLRKMISRPPFKARLLIIDGAGFAMLSVRQLGWLALWTALGCRADTFSNITNSDIDMINSSGTSYSLMHHSLRKIEMLEGGHIRVLIRKDKKEAKEERQVYVHCNCSPVWRAVNKPDYTACLMHNKYLKSLDLPPPPADLAMFKKQLGIADHSVRRTIAVAVALAIMKGKIFLQKPLLAAFGWSDITQLVQYAPHCYQLTLSYTHTGSSPRW